MNTVTPGLDLIVQSRWQEYARPRFAQGERTVREAQARDLFLSQTTVLFSELQRRAQSGGHSLDYGVHSLRLLVLEALVSPCEYCNEFFGLKTWAVGYRVSPSLGGVRHVLSNLVATCLPCTLARGPISEHVWLRVIEALKAEDTGLAADFLQALMVGRRAMGAGKKGSWVLPGPPPSPVTRSVRVNASLEREK